MNNFISILAIGFVLLLVCKIKATDIVSSGSYAEAIDASDLLAGAGSDLTSSFQSVSDAVTLTISNSGGGNWAIDVHKTDTNWNGDFILKVKKTTGAAVTKTVGNTDVEFFQGSGDGSFNVQIILEGVSIGISPDSYGSSVVFMVRAL